MDLAGERKREGTCMQAELSAFHMAGQRKKYRSGRESDQGDPALLFPAASC